MQQSNTKLTAKIVDSFLFSEVFEKELLLLKFILEEPFVSEWIILENAYSFQGEFKGQHVKALLEGDERFSVYMDRITIISKSHQPKILDKEKVLDDEAFKVEFWQRDLAYDHFIKNYSDDDWIIISDVDEALDFTDSTRCQELFYRMQTDKLGVLHVSTKRYWFDFDNEFKIMYGIPMCTKKYLLNTGKLLHDVRVDYHGDLQMKWDNIIGFEYSSCFDAGNIIRKLETGSHMGFTEGELQKALDCNHRIISLKKKKTLKPTARFFFETIQLTEANSPKFVRDNLAVLKTNNINKNYRQNRKDSYPHFYSPFYKINDFIQQRSLFLKKKFKNVLIKLKLNKLIYE